VNANVLKRLPMRYCTCETKWRGDTGRCCKVWRGGKVEPLRAFLERGGARGTRTLTTLRSADFKSAASTIPPSPPRCDILILSRFCLFVNHFIGSILDAWLAGYAGLLISRCFYFFYILYLCSVASAIQKVHSTGLRGRMLTRAVR
jgi:hypothetical protein